MKSYPYKVSKPLVDITWNLQKGRKLRHFTDTESEQYITDGVFISKINEKTLRNNFQIPEGDMLYRWAEKKALIHREVLRYPPMCLVATIEMEETSYTYVLASTIDLSDNILLVFYPKPYVDLIYSLNTCSRIVCGKADDAYSVYLIFVADDQCVGILSPVIFNPMSNRFIAYHDHFKQLVADAYQVRVSDLSFDIEDQNYKAILG